MVHHINAGDLFQPYSPNLSDDYWRMNPPLLMWWYLYNYYLHGLNPLGWRIINFLFELGIFYVLMVIFKEIKANTENINERYFKIGCLFYIFSGFPILFFLLYAPAVAFPLLLGLCGIYYYIKSKHLPTNLYYSIFCLTLCALTFYPATIWIFGILFLLLLNNEYKRFLIVLIESSAIFCVVSLPLLINDSFGYLSRLVRIPRWETSTPNISYWAFEQDAILLKLLPFVIPLITLFLYLSLTYQNLQILDFFIVAMGISLIYAPLLYPWVYLWIFALLIFNLLYFYKNYIKINIIFFVYLFLYYLSFAILFITYPDPLNSNYYTAFLQIIAYGDSIGVLQLFPIILIPLFQIGLIYLIYLLTKSKFLTFLLIFPNSIFITSNLLIWLGSLLYP
ncbi:MAG: hypothetical protein ACTSRL_22135 [Candidatus Helarchaeota archaeon]